MNSAIQPKAPIQNVGAQQRNLSNEQQVNGTRRPEHNKKAHDSGIVDYEESELQDISVDLGMEGPVGIPVHQKM